ncbi:interleukin-18-like [Labrus mixtus]|uniref:interleukin-18-like n=1 Tax=Labrus mixtus TaxID=508554 RepID=UPI0029C0DD9F|nr:interleukin-18-like [Labrus mixtus]
MATNGFTTATFVDTFEDAFYFEVGETDKCMDSDAFGKTNNCCQCWIQSNNNKFLMLSDDGQFQAQNLNIQQQQSKSGCKFHFQFYNENQSERPGKAVILYSNKDGKNMVVSCSNKHQVCPEEMQDLPGHIEDNKNKVIFYRVNVTSTSCRYLFESSMYRDHYLGLEPDESNRSLEKLVLRHKSSDEVDESTQFLTLKI